MLLRSFSWTHPGPASRIADAVRTVRLAVVVASDAISDALEVFADRFGAAAFDAEQELRFHDHEHQRRRAKAQQARDVIVGIIRSERRHPWSVN